jgi:hypothetical protein
LATDVRLWLRASATIRRIRLWPSSATRRTVDRAFASASAQCSNVASPAHRCPMAFAAAHLRYISALAPARVDTLAPDVRRPRIFTLRLPTIRISIRVFSVWISRREGCCRRNCRRKDSNVDYLTQPYRNLHMRLQLRHVRVVDMVDSGYLLSPVFLCIAEGVCIQTLILRRYDLYKDI